MKTIAYSCPFVPAEWIAAHGMRPSRILPRAVGNGPLAGAGVCPYVRAFVHEVCSAAVGDAIVLTTACDQMRRASEVVERHSGRPVFLLNVPSTWQTVAAQKLYLSELKRLGGFLVGLGGAEPSRDGLAEVMRKYSAARATLRAARGNVSPRRFSEAIAQFHQSGALNCDADEPQRIGGHVPVALVGGPLLERDFDIFDVVETAGGRVVLDATASGELGLPAPFDLRALSDDPFLTLAGAYFGSIPDAFLRPNTALYSWLRKEMAERGVRGILFRRFIWCDTWHAESQRMKEWAGVPFLDVEVGDEKSVNGHAVSRVFSLLEMLR
jgi:benzoyl-CoA reductase/2-hydroxyglutaryl-CoA dehydratase subunit BcrC/BadD/HgdB